MTLITGGASGLGRATVERFAKNGANVVFCDLKTSAGDHIARQINNKNVVYIPANVLREDEMIHVLHEIDERFGRLDAVVNCAGQSETFVTYNFNKMQARDLAGFAWPVKVCFQNETFSLFFSFGNQFNAIFSFSFSSLKLIRILMNIERFYRIMCWEH